MRKYFLQYIKYLTINKSLKKLSNSSTYYNQWYKSGAYSEPKYLKWIFFWNDLTAFSKKLHLKCLRRFWICSWHRNLKYCNLKTSNPPWKWSKRLYILYILNKITLTTENRSTVLHNLFLLDMCIFNELVIKNPVKKQHHSLFSWRGFNCLMTNFWY